MPRFELNGLCRCGNALRPGGQKNCRTCHAAYMRANRPKHRDLTALQQLRANARSYARVYLKRGRLTRKPCETCGANAQMHHDDYTKPLQVRWLCRTHHEDHHRSLSERLDLHAQENAVALSEN